MAQFTDVHDPVLVDRIVALVSPALDRPDAIYVDGTLGLAGHAIAILDANPTATLVGIDRDLDAHAVARERLAGRLERAELVHAVHDQLPEVLAELGIEAVDAILLDLGLSSLQIDRTERGFAYREDAPLDMRMDADDPLTAAEVVNTYSEAELSRVLARYGEEKFAARIARAIVEQRHRSPFSSTAELVATITGAIPAAARHTGGHPAKRTFQGLRIEVNRELATLEAVLPQALASLRLGGVMVVLSYHSLEDRLVKLAFADATTDHAPRTMPVVPEHLKPQFASLTRGAERPSEAEVASNPRAASARLRAVTRIREAA